MMNIAIGHFLLIFMWLVLRLCLRNKHFSGKNHKDALNHILQILIHTPSIYFCTFAHP